MDSFRQFIIRTAEVFIVILVVLITLWFAVGGAGYGQLIGIGWLLGIVIGGAIGFVFGCVSAAYFFLLLEIAKNTRKMAKYYETPGASQ
jgi:hypothetical protein